MMNRLMVTTTSAPHHKSLITIVGGYNSCTAQSHHHHHHYHTNSAIKLSTTTTNTGASISPQRQAKIDAFFRAFEESDVETIGRMLSEDSSLALEKISAKAKVPSKENKGQVQSQSEVNSHINAMMFACQYGFFEVLKELLKHRGEQLIQQDRANKTEQGGYCALHSAIIGAGNYLEFLNTPNPPNMESSTHEQELAYKRNQLQLYLPNNLSWLKCVQLLCEHGVDVTATFGDTDFTPLMYASRHGLIQIVKLLLDHGANPNHMGNERQTALNFAAAYGKSDVAQLLIAAGADPYHQDKDGNNFIKLAADERQPYALNKMAHVLSTMSSLTEEQVTRCRNVWFPQSNVLSSETDLFGNTQLMAAAACGNFEAVSRLIDQGMSPNNINILGWTPLTWSLIQGTNPDVFNQKRIVAKLISAGADPNIPTNDGVVPVANTNNSDIIRMLIQEGKANLSYKSSIDGSTPLVLLLSHTKIGTDSVKIMIDAGADVNVELKDGTRPLFYACIRGHLEPFSLLINAGADPHIVHPQTGVNLMLLAASRGYFDLVRVLVQHRVDFNYRSPNGIHTIFHAIHFGHEPTVSLMLNLGVDPNLKMMELQITPLQVAIIAGHTNIVKTLLAEGADINATDAKGISCMQYAQQKAADNTPNAKEILQLLQEHAAKEQQEEKPKTESS